jgi:hypothetical protein
MGLPHVGVEQKFLTVYRKLEGGKLDGKYAFVIMSFEEGSDTGVVRWKRVSILPLDTKLQPYRFVAQELDVRGYKGAAKLLDQLTSKDQPDTSEFQDFPYLLPDQINP